MIRESLVLTEATHQASYAVRTPDWKLIMPLSQDAHGELIPDVYGRPRDPRSRLFHLRCDPGERHDVAEAHPGIARDLASYLVSWREKELERWGGPDPIATQVSSSAFAGAVVEYHDRAAYRSTPPPALSPMEC